MWKVEACEGRRREEEKWERKEKKCEERKGKGKEREKEGKRRDKKRGRKGEGKGKGKKASRLKSENKPGPPIRTRDSEVKDPA